MQAKIASNALMAITFLCAIVIFSSCNNDEEPGNNSTQNPEGTTFTPANSALSGTQITCITIDASGNKGIGSEKGIHLFDGTNGTNYNTQNSGLSNDSVQCIAIDRHGIKWIGSLYAGLDAFGGGEWQNYELPGGFPFDDELYNYVRNIVFDAQNDMGCVTDYGLKCFRHSTGETTNPGNTEFTVDNSTCLVIDKQGSKGIGTSLFGIGVCDVDNANWIYYNTQTCGLTDNYITCLAIDTKENKGIGMFNAGISVFDGANGTSYTTENSGLLNDFINCITVDAKGNLGIGTGGGLSVFDGTNWTSYTTENSDLAGNFVTCITIDANGDKGIGSLGGISVLKTK